MNRDEELWRLEEEFHGPGRKESRKERKRVTSKDRSKFKKTDQDQRKKQEQDPCQTLQQGRVIAITPEGIVVNFGDKTTLCHLRGSLKHERNQSKNLVAVGDVVYVEQQPPHPGLITRIATRSSVLSRADNLSRNKEHLIAVNVDQVLITASVVSPPLKPPLIDRYIIAAQKGNMLPIIVINKIDLLPDHPDAQQEYETFVETYRKLGFQVLPISTATSEGIETLGQVMKGKTSVFSGQSGVGKSSLINALTQSSLATGQVVERTQKGSHTTTVTRLVPLDSGGFCVDTPGIKSFGVWDLKAPEIAAYFPEIARLSTVCRYPDCSHHSEPHCAVRDAVESGEISSLRFESYLSLMRSVQAKHQHR